MKAVGLGIFCVIISLQLVCEADATESSSKHAYGNYDNGAYGVYGRGFATPTFLPSEPDIFLYIYTENADHSWTVRRSPTPALVRNSNTQENTQVNSNAVETTENSVNTRNTQHPQSSPTRGDESHGSEKFSTDMLFTIVEALEKYDANFVLSPISVWSALVLVAEGARDESFNQLEKVLYLPKDLDNLRLRHKSMQRLLMVNTSTVELNVNQALISDENRPLDAGYVDTLAYTYEADQISVDFQDPKQAAKKINDHISAHTNGKIKDLIKPDDLMDAPRLMLSSSIFFNGRWRFPFNINDTVELPFYREDNTYINHVPMMILQTNLPYITVDALNASIVEMPYGDDNRISMLLLYPHWSLTEVFRNLRNADIGEILNMLMEDEEDRGEVRLTLPKFKIDSDLELRNVLEVLGIIDIFDAEKANLSKISKSPVVVSRVFHKAVIDVDEVGTMAAAVTVGYAHDRIVPPEVVFNRPFGFLITDRATKSILFAGQVRHPTADK